jgi:ligand-binding sensor domain-containing protein/signal transduction histidine kinase
MRSPQVAGLLLTVLFPLAGAVPRKLPDGYTRRVWQMQDGLPENTVQAFAQTPDHYLWIGTSGGLVRFDGARFVVLDRDNTPLIRQDNIFCLTAGRDGSLWAGTDGMGLLRYHNGVFRAYSAGQGLTNEFVRAVREDRNGTLWVGTDDGLFRMEGDRLRRVDGTGGIPALAVHAIYEDRSGNLWVGGSTLLRISLFNGLSNNRVEDCKEFHLEGGGSATRVKSILETGDGAIWVGTVSGLQRMGPGGPGGVTSGRFVRAPEIHNTVRSLLADGAGALWIGAIGGGLSQYAGGRFTAITAADVAPSGTVLALFEDDERNIWVGMQTGLLRLSRTAMNAFPLPDTANADFGTVYPDADGSLWVASTNLYRINARRDHSELMPPPFPGVRVRNVMRERSGALWIGTEGEGAFRIQNGQRVQYKKSAGLVNDFVRALLETRDGSVWIGTDEGISRWHNGAIANFSEADGLAYFSIRALLEDRAGDVWIGTERGVSHWRNGAFVQDDVARALRSEKVWAIHQDADGGLWFGTRGAGLFRWRDGKMSGFGNAQGLASNSIYQILEDARGVFWMSGPNGISAVARSDLDRAASHPGFRPAVTLYGLSDGVEATQIHGGVSPAGCLTAGGEIWFPSNRGPVRILPLEGRPEAPPEVVIEQAVVDGREMPGSAPLVAPPGQGKLQIDYSAIRLRSQERIGFRYMLEGFDREWTEAVRRRVAYYTNLPPRHYRFRVQAFLMNMPESVTEASLPIDWRPHLYRTPWFLASCGALAMAMALAAYRLRLRQVHARFRAVLQERNRVAREMHDTVIQGCTGVSALLEGVAALGSVDEAYRRELIDHARTQVRVTVDEARRAVWNLRQSGSGPLEEEIGPLLDRMAQQASHASRVPVRFETFGTPARLDPAVEHDILMVAREAVYNAVRHAQPKEVRLQVFFEDHKIRMRVADDGCGFDPEEALAVAGEHFGIVGMRERTERLGGRFDLRSAPGSGTELVFEAPVRSAAAEKLGMDLHS